MKKNFLYSLLMAAAALFTVACSKEEDKTLEGVPGTYEGRNLSVAVNNVLLDDADMSVTVSGDDRNDMTFVAENIFFGQESYTISGVQFRVDEYDNRIFAADASTDCNKVTISGKIASGKMTLSISQEGVTGVYDTGSGSLTLALNDAPFSGKASVEMQGASSSDMQMILKNVVLGADEFTISSLTITEETATSNTREGSLTPYKISGSAKDAYREVTVSGRIDATGMNLNVTVKNLGDLVGSQWKIAVDPQMKTPTIMLEMETTQESIEFGEGTMTPEEFVTSMRGLVGMAAAQYFSALQYIEFQADGNISLLVHDPANDGAPIEIPNELIPEGAIRWYMAEGKVMFVVDAEMINMIPGGFGEIITGFFEVKNGMLYVPLNFKKTATGVAVYLDKAFLMQALPVVKQLLADMELDPSIGTIINLLLPQIETIVTESSVFNAGFELEKVTK